MVALKLAKVERAKIVANLNSRRDQQSGTLMNDHGMTGNMTKAEGASTIMWKSFGCNYVALRAESAIAIHRKMRMLT